MTKGQHTCEVLRKRIAAAPTSPGVYRWYDKHRNILYIGKAKNLRNRLRSYVQKDPKLSPWKEMLCRQIAAFDFTVTANELEALILETNLIKTERPKYNVLMKDDKNYSYIKVTVQDPFPRVEIVRRLEEDLPRGGDAALRGDARRVEPRRGHAALYFGPYLQVWQTERTLETLHEVFGYRACQRSLDALNAGKKKSPECLDHHIGRCNGLCVSKVTEEEYRERIGEVVKFFRGNHETVKERLKEMMQEAASDKKFERAAKLRDTLGYITSLEQQQVVSDTSGQNSDFIGVSVLNGKAQVVVLRERGGKVISELPFMLSGQPETAADVLSQFLPQYYLSVPVVPETIVIGEEIEDRSLLEDWLNDKRLTNERITIHVARRGKKRKLLTMANRNAEEKLQQQLASFEAEDMRVKDSLKQLKEALKLRNEPHRIECYDISHLGGTETVGSMVVFVNGKPKKEHYRSFTLRTLKKGEVDDYKALQEVLTRRLRHLKKTQENEERKLAEQGIRLRTLRKKELSIVEGITQEHGLDAELLDYRTFIVAERHTTRHPEEPSRILRDGPHGPPLEDVRRAAGRLEGSKDIVAFCRIKVYKSGLREMGGLWVSEDLRGKRLGHILARRVLQRIKKGKVYLTCEPGLTRYYEEIGFEEIRTAPQEVAEKVEHVCRVRFPDGVTLMAFDAARNKPDPSLTSTPDLLLIDGGKGQLGVGVKAVKEAGLEIPCAALAKEKEEVFIAIRHPEERRPRTSRRPFGPPQCDVGAARLEGPIPTPETARFLLMRLRDEAHRFANSHREKRVKKALI